MVIARSTNPVHNPVHEPIKLWIPDFQYDKSNIDFRLAHADNDLLFFLNLSYESLVNHNR